MFLSITTKTPQPLSFQSRRRVRDICCVSKYLNIKCSLSKYHVRFRHGVAMTSRLLKNIGLFCRIQSLLWGPFAKETYVFREFTNRSQPTAKYHNFCRLNPTNSMDIRSGGGAFQTRSHLNLSSSITYAHIRTHHQFYHPHRTNSMCIDTCGVAFEILYHLRKFTNSIIYSSQNLSSICHELYDLKITIVPILSLKWHHTSGFRNALSSQHHELCPTTLTNSVIYMSRTL